MGDDSGSHAIVTDLSSVERVPMRDNPKVSKRVLTTKNTAPELITLSECTLPAGESLKMIHEHEDAYDVFYGLGGKGYLHVDVPDGKGGSSIEKYEIKANSMVLVPPGVR